MSDTEPSINGNPISSLRVVDLKQELDKHGLSKLGNKSALVERLREFLLTGKTSDGGSPVKDGSASPTKSPVAENPMVAEYRARQKALLEGKSSSDEKSPTTSPRKRNSNSTSVPVEDLKEETKVSERRSPRKAVTISKEEDESTNIASNTSNNDDNDENSSKEAVKAAEKDKVLPIKSDKSREKVEKSSPVKEIEPNRGSDGHKSDNVSDDVKAEEKSESKKEKTPVVEKIEKKEEKPKVEEKKEPKHEKKEPTPVKAPSPAKTAPVKAPSPVEETPAKAPVPIDTSTPIKPPSPVKEPTPPPPKAAPVKETKPIVKPLADQEELELDYEDAEELNEDEPHNEKDEVMEVDKEVSKSTEAEKPSSDERSNKRHVSPSRHPESTVIHIRGLVRPFTDGQLKNLIKEGGVEISEYWIDSIKSHCFVQVNSVEQARTVRENMHGINWPCGNLKTLSVQFDTRENLDKHKTGNTSASTETPAKVSASRSSEKDHRERPSIGQLPGRNGSLRVTVEAAVRDNKKRDIEVKERIEKEREHHRTTSTTHADKEKERVEAPAERRNNNDDDRKRTRDERHKDEDEENRRKRRRSETPPFSRGATERRRRHSEKEKEEPAPVIKTADSLFKKTNAQPKIYYMPLSDEEAEVRQAKRALEKKRDEERRR